MNGNSSKILLDVSGGKLAFVTLILLRKTGPLSK